MSEIAQVIVEDLAKPQTPVPPVEAEKPIAPEPEKPDVKKEKEPLSVRFAALTKREKQIQEREKAIKEQEAKFKNFELTKESVVKSPKEALESIGLSFEDFTKAYLDQLDGKEHKPSLEEKFEGLYSRIEAKEKAEKEREEQAKKEAEQAAIDNFKSQVKDFVSADKEKFELINESGLFDEVYNVIEEYFNETGEILATEKAAEHVENHLYEEGQKLLKAKKFAPKMPEPGKGPEKTASSTTLTNKLTPASPATSPVESKKLLSNEESLARAAALLKFK